MHDPFAELIGLSDRGGLPRECRIWRAVILQMILDAKSQSQKPAAQKQKKIALDWLNIENPNFVKTCELAFFDPYWVWKMYLNAQKRGFQWRKTPQKFLPVQMANVRHYEKGQQIELFIILPT